MTALEDAGHGRAALAVEPQVADPRDLAGVVTRAPSRSAHTAARTAEPTPPCCASGSVAIGPIHAARFTSGSRSRSSRPTSSRAANAVPRSIATTSSSTQCGYSRAANSTRAGAGFTLDDDAGRRFAPERRRDRHVDPDEVAGEAERLEQHAGARVRDVDTRPDVARDGVGEVRGPRAVRSPRVAARRARAPCRARGPVRRDAPRRAGATPTDVVAELLDRERDGAALVADHLVTRSVSRRASARPR